MRINQKMDKALTIKNNNFFNDITFSYPNDTIAITTTGCSCDLKCAHCNGHYLKNMVDIKNVQEKCKKNITSVLLSGGCRFDGTVPLIECLDDVAELKNKGYRINAHLGLMDDNSIKQIAKYIDVASFDIVLDNDVIKNVYKSNKKREDYINTYKTLKKYVKVIPHICIGLYKGNVKYEYEVLDFLEKEKPDGITFIVLIPTIGTDYENENPPNIKDVIDVICEARIRFSDIPINLGCMRPRGEYRRKLDEMAILSGINNIVLPSKSAVKMANDMGLNIKKTKEQLNSCQKHIQKCTDIVKCA